MQFLISTIFQLSHHGLGTRVGRSLNASMLKLGVQYAQNMHRNIYAWVLCCTGTATTTSTFTTIPQHKVENIQALDISKPSNGGGKIDQI